MKSAEHGILNRKYLLQNEAAITPFRLRTAANPSRGRNQVDELTRSRLCADMTGRLVDFSRTRVNRTENTDFRTPLLFGRIVADLGSLRNPQRIALLQ